MLFNHKITFSLVQTDIYFMSFYFGFTWPGKTSEYVMQCLKMLLWKAGRVYILLKQNMGDDRMKTRKEIVSPHGLMSLVIKWVDFKNWIESKCHSKINLTFLSLFCVQYYSPLQSGWHFIKLWMQNWPS